MNPQELIAALRNQHHELQDVLTSVLGISMTEEKDENFIMEYLSKFKNDIHTHLELENVVFYPAYIEALKKRGEDTQKVQAFIKDMDVIGDAVVGFLDKYPAAETIYRTKDEFKKKLVEIIEILTVRIEEEDKIFDYYLQF